MNFILPPSVAAIARPVWKIIRPYWPLLIALAVLAGYFEWQVHGFLSGTNTVRLLRDIAINAILAFGLTLVILIGGIDLSVGAVYALAGVVCVSLLSGAGIVVGLLAGLGVAVLVGCVSGTIAARTSMPPFIITLAMMRITRGCALGFNQGRPLSVADDQTAFLDLGNYVIGGWLPLPVVFMLVLFAVATLLLHFTRFGQHLFAIGGNREAARFTGISIPRHEVIVYSFCGLCAGIAGMIGASQIYSATPSSGEGFELDAIAAVVVGGTSFSGGIGSMPGTLLGAIIIGVLGAGLNMAGVNHYVQYIIKGVVILAAVWLDVRKRK
jgi:ribose transport system permease protein